MRFIQVQLIMAELLKMVSEREYNWKPNFAI